eukprot:g1424.t1
MPRQEAAAIELVERGVGLRPTKIGPDAKTEGYIVDRLCVRRLGACLLVTAVLLVLMGFGLEHDIGVMQQQVGLQHTRLHQNKKLLFRMKELNMLDEAQQEAKLIKVLTVLQQHFARDRHEVAMTRAFGREVNSAMGDHKRSIDDILKNLEGNPPVVAYLKKTLYKASEDFHREANALTEQYTRSIIEQGRSAEKRLDVLTQAVTKELEADSKEERRERTEQARLALRDPVFAAVERDITREGRSVTRDERDVEDLLVRFKQKVDALPPMRADADTRAAALALAARLARARVGGKDGAADGAAARKKKVAILKRAGEPVDAAVPVATRWERFMDRVRYRDVAASLSADFKRWKAEQLSDVEMMLAIEKLVAKGKVNAAWLHEGESRQVEDEMLRVGQEDHTAHKRLQDALLASAKSAAQMIAKTAAANAKTVKTAAANAKTAVANAGKSRGAA